MRLSDRPRTATASVALERIVFMLGTLVIVGGGATDNTGIVEKFIELAGGPDKKFVIVPTAGGNRNREGALVEHPDRHNLRR